MTVLLTKLHVSRGQHGRRAFTLVELMVSLALIVFIMSILSSAFVTASKTFSDLKAAGDLAENLRGVMTLLRRDLKSPHFTPTNLLVSQVIVPPQSGFFRIYQGVESNAGFLQQPPAGSTVQGAIQGPTGPPPTFTLASGNIPAYVNAQSMLHFTVVLPAATPGDFFTTSAPNPTATQPGPLFNPTWSTIPNQDNRYQPVPPGTGNSQPPTATTPLSNPAVFKSQYAEVVWWMSPSTNPDGTNNMTSAGPNAATQFAQQLYTLRRRQRLIWPEAGITIPPPAPPPYTSISVGPQIPVADMQNGLYPEVSIPLDLEAATGTPPPTIFANTMSTVTLPPFRFGMYTANSPYLGTPLPQTKRTGESYAGTGTRTGPTTNYSTQNAKFPNATGSRVDDIVIDNVLSFSVRVLIQGSNSFVPLSDSTVQAYSNNNLAFPSATGPWVYDTWSSQTLGIGTNNGAAGQYNYGYPNYPKPMPRGTPQITAIDPSTGQPFQQWWQQPGTYASMPLWRNSASKYISIQAIQVTLRLWDFKSQTARQVSMVQVM